MGRDKIKSASLHSFHDEHVEPLPPPPAPAPGTRTPFENLVRVRDIEIYSLCEHHLLPFFGRAHVAYLPNGRLVGLSKIPRVIEVFARRLQVQERLTDQVADALMEVLDPRGVGVVIEAYHLCMMMRGVEKQNSKTITSALRGALLQDAKTRDEFLRLVYSGRGPGLAT